jgi:hypothetical protein
VSVDVVACKLAGMRVFWHVCDCFLLSRILASSLMKELRSAHQSASSRTPAHLQRFCLLPQLQWYELNGACIATPVAVLILK